MNSSVESCSARVWYEPGVAYDNYRDPGYLPLVSTRLETSIMGSSVFLSVEVNGEQLMERLESLMVAIALYAAPNK